MSPFRRSTRACRQASRIVRLESSGKHRRRRARCGVAAARDSTVGKSDAYIRRGESGAAGSEMIVGDVAGGWVGSIDDGRAGRIRGLPAGRGVERPVDLHTDRPRPDRPKRCRVQSPWTSCFGSLPSFVTVARGPARRRSRAHAESSPSTAQRPGAPSRQSARSPEPSSDALPLRPGARRCRTPSPGRRSSRRGRRSDPTKPPSSRTGPGSPEHGSSSAGAAVEDGYASRRRCRRRARAALTARTMRALGGGPRRRPTWSARPPRRRRPGSGRAPWAWRRSCRSRRT